MASTDLTRTHTVATADERKKHTFSAWIKLSHIGSTSNTFFANRPSNNFRFYYMIVNSGAGSTYANKFYCYMVYNGSTMLEATGTRVLRDTNGWYHIVVRTDTTQGTGADRFRVYINGEQETLTMGHTPDQDEELQVNRDTVHYIGEEGNGNGQFDGSMSHIHFCDGYSYAPTEFGETDSTTGEWKINTSPSVSYGTNGFFILKDGNSVTDQSGNSHNWTVNAGTLTKTQDCPSNVFCTINILDKAPISFTLANGATTLNDSGSADNDNGIKGTMGVNSGKYYWEMKKGSGSGGVHAIVTEDVDVRLGNRATSSPASGLWGFQSNGTGYPLVSYINGTFDSTSNTLQGWGANDIIGFALDMDNGKLYLSKNGTFYGLDGNSSDPANATNPAITGIPTGDKFVFPYFEKRSADSPETMCNFGNGYFGTTAVSSNSGNGYAADGSLGIFQYQPPTGYTALCTKGLNQ